MGVAYTRNFSGSNKPTSELLTGFLLDNYAELAIYKFYFVGVYEVVRCYSSSRQ